jgi:hypothetical protein
MPVSTSGSLRPSLHSSGASGHTPMAMTKLASLKLMFWSLDQEHLRVQPECWCTLWYIIMEPLCIEGQNTRYIAPHSP